jgi:hypothetical protein
MQCQSMVFFVPSGMTDDDDDDNNDDDDDDGEYHTFATNTNGNLIIFQLVTIPNIDRFIRFVFCWKET